MTGVLIERTIYLRSSAVALNTIAATFLAYHFRSLGTSCMMGICISRRHAAGLFSTRRLLSYILVDIQASAAASEAIIMALFHDAFESRDVPCL